MLPFNVYVLVPVPPPTVKVIVPSESPSHVGSVWVSDIVITDGCVTVLLIVPISPLLSFIYIVCVPTGTDENVVDD